MNNQFYLAVTAAILFGLWGGYMFGFGRSKIMAAENILLNEEIDRLIEEFDKAWRHDLNDKNNVQVLAAELARLSTENESLRHGIKGDYDLDAWLDWTHEAKALREDAGRYRFLRNGPDGVDLADAESMEEIDALIDAAMSKEAGHD